MTFDPSEFSHNFWKLFEYFGGKSNPTTSGQTPFSSLLEFLGNYAMHKSLWKIFVRLLQLSATSS